MIEHDESAERGNKHGDKHGDSRKDHEHHDQECHKAYNGSKTHYSVASFSSFGAASAARLIY